MNEEQLVNEVCTILNSDEHANLEHLICQIKWQLTASVHSYFLEITKLYKEKKIGKKRYDWLTKERPFKLIKELVDDNTLIHG